MHGTALPIKIDEKLTNSETLDTLYQPTIIIASEESLKEAIAKKFMSMFNPLHLDFETSLIKIIPRIFGSSNKLSYDQLKKLPFEEKLLLFVRLYAGTDFNIPRYLPEEAYKKFEFENGYKPKNGEIFFQHPFYPNKYIFPAMSNLKLAKEKINVFMRLAGTLGAKTIKLNSGVVKTKNWRGGAKVPLNVAASQVGLKASADSESVSSTNVFAAYDKPDKDPYVPDDLIQWVKHDEDFETLVKSRLESKLRIQRVSIELKEKDKFSCSVIGKYAKLGFEIGGKYDKLVHSVWHYEIEYWPT